MRKLISYIIPFYNGQDSILTCINSILSVELKESEYEIIVVDDCSPVSAKSVLVEYTTKYNNIQVIRHTINKRQGGAKNTGIQLAKGEYIAFADQDDFINTQEAIKALLFAIDNKVDMLACHYNIQKENGDIIEYGINDGNRLTISGKEFCEQYFIAGYNLAPWANLYRREYLMQLARPFEENVVMEDSDWIAWHWIHADKVGVLNIPIYTWIMNPASITHSQHYINRADWIKFGFRKISDARLFKSKSPIFAEIMENDGKQNIIGGMLKVWKVDNYCKFYAHLGSTLQDLQQIKWPGIVRFLIQHPLLSCICLYPIGSILKLINYARHQCK